MDILLTVAAACGPAYFLGSVPFGLVVARLFKGIDIRRHGSKNIGATNVARVCGRPWGVLVFALDFLKGVLPAALWAGSRVFQGWAGDLVDLAPVLAGLGTILGHVFPAYLGFRGGRGVATAAGVFVVLTPVPAGIALATWALLAALFRYVSLASVVAASVLLVAQALLDGKAFGARLPITIFVAAVVALVVLRHIPNIRRLLAGTENKIGARRPAEDQGEGVSRKDAKPAKDSP